MLGAFRLNTISAAAASSAYWLMYNIGARASNITPGGFDVDSVGNIYILDMYSSKIAKIDPTGAIIWKKSVSTPSTALAKGDNGLLALSSTGNYVLCAWQESSTSISLCWINASTGALISKGVTSVAAGSSINLGNVTMGVDGSSVPWAFMTCGVTVGGVNRLVFKKYTITGQTTMATTATTTYHHLAAGATSIYDTRLAYNPNNQKHHILAYQSYITLSSGHNTLTVPSPTRSMGVTFDSIALDNIESAFAMRDNTIYKFSTANNGKVWEVTHTVGGVGGSHFYNQGMAIDSANNIYACYWNSTSGKFIIYKLNSTGALQWTKSLSPTGFAVEPDAMSLKVVGNDLYIAFKYGASGDIDSGMAILKIPTDGTLTKTFTNGFVLGNETGAVTASTLFSNASNTPVTTAVTIGTTGSAFTLADTTLPTYTKSSI